MNRKLVCIKFKEQLKTLYNNNPNNLIDCFYAYLGFIMSHSLDDRYKQYTHWQVSDMLMSIHNPLINTSREVLETAWNYTRRGGKSRGLTVIAVFFVLLDKQVIWRCPHTDQLHQCTEWFIMNPFVEEEHVSTQNTVKIYNSPEINISVLSAGRVASREADILIYDEMGWCFNHLAIYEFYKASRPMIAASSFKHIIHASTPAKNTVFHEEWEALKELEEKYNSTFTSWHPWRDTTWITKEWVEMERLKNFDCPWYVDQNYEALFVVYGGAIFNNIISLGDLRYPEYPMNYFDRFIDQDGKIHPSHAGVDFNGDIVGHYLVEIKYDDNFVYVIREERFNDLNRLSELPLWSWKGDPELSLEVEDGLFNIPFANQLRRMGIPAIYKEMDEYMKMDIIADLKKRKIIIDRRACPVTFKNLTEAAYDQNSRLPKLEKRNDQHGLDALIHALHGSGGRIHFRDKNRKDLFGRTTIYNPITHI